MDAWLATLVAQLLIRPDDRAQMDGMLVAVVGGDAGAYLDACRLLGEAADPQGALDAVADLPDVAAVTLVGALIIRSFAAVRMDYRSRQDATAARAALGAAASDAYQSVGDAFGHVVLDWLVHLVGAATVELSSIAAARAPLVRVETGISLPSSLLAFDLYGDPARGAEIVARNRCGTAMLMPVAFEALSD